MGADHTFYPLSLTTQDSINCIFSMLHEHVDEIILLIDRLVFVGV